MKILNQKKHIEKNMIVKTHIYKNDSWKSDNSYREQYKKETINQFLENCK